MFGSDDSGSRIGRKLHFPAVLYALSLPVPIVGLKFGNLRIAGLLELLDNLLERHPIGAGHVRKGRRRAAGKRASAKARVAIGRIASPPPK
jgi:hypothetical protein